MSKGASLTLGEETECLKSDPFDGYDTGAKLLSDTILTVRKTQDRGCDHCRGDVVKGSRARVRSERRGEGEYNNFRWCASCCRALAAGGTAGESWTRRKGLFL